MTGKRPHDANGDGGDPKRLRAEDGSPRTAAAVDGMSNVERRKQEMAARMAALKAKMATGKPNGVQNGAAPSPPPPAAPATRPPTQASPPTPVQAPESPAPSGSVAEARAAAAKKIAEIKARMAARQGGAAPSPVNGADTTNSLPQKSDPVADARARAAEIARQNRKDSPALPAPPPRQDGRTARGGLGIGLHPSLLGDAGGDRARQDQRGPKYGTTKGNLPPQMPRVNPYLSGDSEPSKDQQQDPSFAPAVRKPVERKSKLLVFSEKGKYMAQANALRQAARLEEMKRRIAAENRKTEIEEASDKAFLVPEPPGVEWWDELLLAEGVASYEDWDQPGNNRIEGDDSIITALIQRPVLLQAPQDKFLPAAKPLMLTTKEQKKIRRQRRMADMKEEQAKIRLGLVEPPPPKVKKSNMMRVLGEQAVKDPTAVEARVNKEIAQRAYDHEKANLDRKLTPQQRSEKLKQQQEADADKGVKVAIFKVDDLSCGKHRYQIDQNAKQNALTGIVILNPTMNVIIVEGGAHSIKSYKKLLLNRVKWTENIAPVGDRLPTTFTATTDGSNANVTAGTRGQGSKAAEWCNPFDEDGNLKNLSSNQCILVWEGDEAERRFKRWGSRACETDGEAKDVLSRTKMENMWTLARSKTS